MNTKHTPGKLELQFERDGDRYQLRVGGRSVAHFCGWSADGVTTEAEDAANAARLAECWNMHDELVRQRDELAEALRVAVRLWQIRRDTTYATHNLPAPKDEAPDWIRQARSVLAKLSAPQ